MMMKLPVLAIILTIMLLSSCKTLNIREIKSMEKESFQNLELSHGEEHNELRIDVIRQVTETFVNETTTIQEDVPYHPLGFNLGNGLFYDLNGNLSLRLDQLFNFNPDEPFELRKDVRPENENNAILHTYYNGALLVTRLPKGKSKEAYRKQYQPDSIAFLTKDRIRYTIYNTDSTLCYAYRNNKPMQIVNVDEHNYYTFRRKKLHEFKISDNHLILGNTFSIRLSKDNNTITINSPRREKNQRTPWLTIQKNEREIFIYSKRYKGRKIEFTDYGILLTGTDFKPTLFKLSVDLENFNVLTH